MTLDSPGVFVLGTAYVQDVLGLRTRYPDAAPVKVLKGLGKCSSLDPGCERDGSRIS